jgi:hypothetical protein
MVKMISETVLQGLNEEFTVSDYAARLAHAFGDLDTTSSDLNAPSMVRSRNGALLGLG